MPEATSMVMLPDWVSAPERVSDSSASNVPPLIETLEASSVSMSGGTLDADESLTLSGALTQSGNITIDVASGKTLTYSGASLNLGANTLTMSGEGRLSNSNALVLNNASSKLLLDSITVDNVSTSLASLGLDVDNNSTVSSLTVGHTTPVSMA